MITLLTRPVVPFRLRELKYGVRAALARLTGRQVPVLPAHGGHAAVNRSVFEGFKQLGIPFNVDPPAVSEVGDIVFVIADVRALRQAIRWKRSRRIAKLHAGFALVSSPQDEGGVILDPALDRYVCFSDWHADSFELRAPGFRARAVVCPFGVDPSKWAPRSGQVRPRTSVLFFKKRAPWPLYEEALAKVRSAGFDVEEIIYGSYKLEDYAEAIQRNSLVIYWNNVETQGIAMAEAWAADIPTLVYNCCEVRVIRNRLYTFKNDASPYLSEATGAFFENLPELEALLARHRAGGLGCAPREWVLNHLTDAHCASHLAKSLELSSSAEPAA